MADSGKTLADRIEDVLPQTQCTKCGYPACRPYAEAIANGTAAHNQCPPGGAEGVARIAVLLGKAVIPLNPVNGVERERPVAVIDEGACIGCTLYSGMSGRCDCRRSQANAYRDCITMHRL